MRGRWGGRGWTSHSAADGAPGGKAVVVTAGCNHESHPACLSCLHCGGFLAPPPAGAHCQLPPSLLALLPARCAPQVDRMISETESKPENAFVGSSVRQPLAWMPAALAETAACAAGAAAFPPRCSRAGTHDIHLLAPIPSCPDVGAGHEVVRRAAAKPGGGDEEVRPGHRGWHPCVPGWQCMLLLGMADIAPLDAHTIATAKCLCRRLLATPPTSRPFLPCTSSRRYADPPNDRLLPDLPPHARHIKTLVLDLDDVLVHSDWTRGR